MKTMIEGNDQTLIRELLSGKNVLIVDDDDDYAEALDEVFTLQGCQVTRISDPLKAMDQALAREYDLMIVDKNMPKLDGLDFVERVRKARPASKIVMITAYPNEDSRRKSLDCGVRYYLSKPFRKNDRRYGLIVSKPIGGCVQPHGLRIAEKSKEYLPPQLYRREPVFQFPKWDTNVFQKWDEKSALGQEIYESNK